MPTAQSLFNDAMKELNILDAGESPSSVQSDDGLIRLNALIDSWNQVELMATAATIGTQATVANTQTYALATRYARIVAASHILPSGGGTMPIQVLDWMKFNQIPDRDISGNWIRFLAYDRGGTTGTIWVSPKPLGVGTVQFVAWAAQTQFASLATSLTLLPGWQRALTAALAVEIAPLYSREPDKALLASKAEAIAELRQLNSTLMGDMAATPVAAGG